MGQPNDYCNSGLESPEGESHLGRQVEADEAEEDDEGDPDDDDLDHDDGQPRNQAAPEAEA